MNLRKKTFKQLGVGISSIVGWGLFAKEHFKKGDLIGEYVGEYIDNNILNERSEYIDLQGTTYLFTLNDDYTIDSRTMGNSLRFANHSKLKANAYSKVIFAGGNHRICLYASKEIKRDEEIFFDYDGQNLLCLKYNWINDGKNSRKNKRKRLFSDDEEEVLPRFRARKTVYNVEQSYLNRKRKYIENNNNNSFDHSFNNDDEEKFNSSNENLTNRKTFLNHVKIINEGMKDKKNNNEIIDEKDNEELGKIKDEIQHLLSNISNEEMSEEDDDSKKENLKKEDDINGNLLSFSYSKGKFGKIQIDNSEDDEEEEDHKKEEENMNKDNISKMIENIKLKMKTEEEKKKK